MKKLLSITAVALIAGCTAPLASMQPVQREGQDMVYANGTPVLLSRGRQIDIVISPVTGSAGRYAIDSRVAFVVQVWNLSGQRAD